MKKIIAFLLIALLLLPLAACTAPAEPADTPSDFPCDLPPEESDPFPAPADFEAMDIPVGTLNGNTGVATAWLMYQAEQGLTADHYDFTIFTAPDQATAALLSGEVQIAALPTNVAASLYNRSEGMIRLAAIAAYGVLHILENGNEIHSIADLAGHTIHTTGEGAGPEFILNHVLTQNGLTPGVDVTIEFHANEALAAGMAAGQFEISMMPEPMVTSVLAQNEDVRRALDMTDEWGAVTNGPLVMSTVVVRTDFAETHPEAVARFLELLQQSIETAQVDPDTVGYLAAKFDLIPNAAIAARAIPGCNLIFIAGALMEPTVIGYLEVLYTAYPDSIGGAIPGESFYFIGQ